MQWDDRESVCTYSTFPTSSVESPLLLSLSLCEKRDQAISYLGKLGSEGRRQEHTIPCVKNDVRSSVWPFRRTLEVCFRQDNVAAELWRATQCPVLCSAAERSLPFDAPDLNTMSETCCCFHGGVCSHSSVFLRGDLLQLWGIHQARYKYLPIPAQCTEVRYSYSTFACDLYPVLVARLYRIMCYMLTICATYHN